jgi:hypothetical protein
MSQWSARINLKLFSTPISLPRHQAIPVTAKTTRIFATAYKHLPIFCPGVRFLLENDYFDADNQQNKVFSNCAAN